MKNSEDNINNIQNNIEIDLSEIDWNKLSPEEFIKLESKLQENQKLLKKTKPKTKRSSGFKHINIGGKTYLIKEIIYKRLLSMKSEKSKQKLIDEIVSTHNEIDSL
jgi:hypothetical protein